ncbi:DDE-domain-containing protein [Sporormia fimetaria CBS 119925]|uniref:DDE-domain-containing protein n=1 Tax=Sporormia fimetaria CBS 119925 TaxID=1340428 RepID=A0A6A6UTZ5_9PLEO|nr:DDE-domain-containing protein [Sporormia fimetaria CBS 119925]
MPSHSSHLLRPLDVGCFSPLKKAYGRQVEGLRRNHINHITKLEFLPCFKAAFFASLTKSNIQGGQELRAIATLDNSINGMQFQPDDAERHTTERVNTYIIECLERYWASEPIDTDLWEEYRADFEG